MTAPSNGRESHPTFQVDTNLFKELGELLVGRDSTALVELIKNSYDADATEVVVYGESLSDRERGFIAISDDGTGMNPQEFNDGFLRIASRMKNAGERRSSLFQRRYTGAKGVGRLAAHKLARFVGVVSLRWDGKPASNAKLVANTGVDASIDWDKVESVATLDELSRTDAIAVSALAPSAKARPGTIITLRRLRHGWTRTAHTRFLEEIQTFAVPAVLVEPLPAAVVEPKLLFERPLLRDTGHPKGGQFTVTLEGDLAPSEEFWKAKVQAASWILEIDASESDGKVHYAIAPTNGTSEEYKDARRYTHHVAHPSPREGPFFHARILMRSGRAWEGRANGVRIFVEGFRVLPYGEMRNDWLSLDRDASERGRNRFITRSPDDPLGEVLGESESSPDEGLLIVPNKHYFGGVFLTQHGGRCLRTLVNREGFVPDGAYESLVNLVRGGIDLLTRARAAATAEVRAQRSAERRRGRDNASAPSAAILRSAITQAHATAREARQLLSTGRIAEAEQKLLETIAFVDAAQGASDELISERTMLRILASVGTQMAAFVHEINGLVGTAEAVDHAMRRLRSDAKSRRTRSKEHTESLATVMRIVSDLRRNLERQASYLVDVVTPDARRRRAKQTLAERFGSAMRLIDHVAEARGIKVENGIPATLQSPPMFPAELTTVFSNILTNAVKAAGDNGRIRSSARRLADGVEVRVENTGVAVDLAEAERWFKAFESSTSRVDAVLGQGMGMGLPITRSVLADYGGSIQFVPPSPGFSTAVQILLPGR